MNLEMYRWNGNKTELKQPTLKEILEFGQPFAVTLPLKEGQRIPDEIILGNWNCSWFSAWPGIRVFDHENKRTYELSKWDYEEGKRMFECRPEIVPEWSMDKYHSRANWYRFQGDYPDEIFSEFKKLGFEFEEDRK
jgi:hypothetical protein